MRILSQEIKLKIYNEYTSCGVSMPKLSKKYDMSISSIYKLRKEIESQNPSISTDKQNDCYENTFHCNCTEIKEHLIIMSCIASL